jgi:hypothetical protein
MTIQRFGMRLVSGREACTMIVHIRVALHLPAAPGTHELAILPVYTNFIVRSAFEGDCEVRRVLLLPVGHEALCIIKGRSAMLAG